jgi:hypothetical protein
MLMLPLSVARINPILSKCSVGLECAFASSIIAIAASLFLSSIAFSNRGSVRTWCAEPPSLEREGDRAMAMRLYCKLDACDTPSRSTNV